jgi:hypothetical protein
MLKELEAVFLSQADVKHDDVDGMGGEARDRFRRTRGGMNVVTLPAEVNRKQFADLRFVINDQDRFHSQ